MDMHEISDNFHTLIVWLVNLQAVGVYAVDKPSLMFVKGTSYGDGVRLYLILSVSPAN